MIVIGRLIAPSAFASLESAGYDRAERTADTPSAQDIVLVDIDQSSLSALGSWPWPRSVHADLLAKLQSDGARLVAFTSPLGTPQNARETERLRAALSLLEASDLNNSEQAEKLRSLLKIADSDPDAQLAGAIASHGNVVLPIEARIGDSAESATGLSARMAITASASALSAAEEASVVRPLSQELQRAAQGVGHVYLSSDTDGVIRTDLTAVKIGSTLLPSLATVIAARAQPTDSDRMPLLSASTLRIGDHTIALDQHLRSRPHFFAQNSRNLVHYSYSQVLDGTVPAAQLRDKIVLVGLADPDTTLRTPAGSTNSQVIIASSVASLMQGSVYLRPPSAAIAEWLVALGVILFAALLLPRAGPGLAARIL